MGERKPEDRPRCETCPYWEDSGLDDGSERREGTCYRWPPVLVSRNPIDETNCADACREWWAQPTVTNCDSCGEHPEFPSWIGKDKVPSMNGIDGPLPGGGMLLSTDEAIEEIKRWKEERLRKQGEDL